MHGRNARVNPLGAAAGQTLRNRGGAPRTGNDGVGCSLQKERAGTFVVRRVRHGLGQATGPVGNGAETRREGAQMSADAWSVLTCCRPEHSPSYVRQTSSWARARDLRCKAPASFCGSQCAPASTVPGAARPRAETATVTDGVTAPRARATPSSPACTPLPPPPASVRHGNTDVRALQPIAGSGRRKGASGRGREQRRAEALGEGREGGARGGVSSPPLTPATLSRPRCKR